MGKIKGDMTIYELMEQYPVAGRVMAERGLMCGGCPMAMMETVENGARAHGVNPEELVNELNELVKKTEKGEE